MLIGAITSSRKTLLEGDMNVTVILDLFKATFYFLPWQITTIRGIIFFSNHIKQIKVIKQLVNGILIQAA